MNKEELKAVVSEGVKEGISAHKCFLDDEEKQLIKDAATGGKLLKRAIIVGICLLILGGLGLSWIKPYLPK